MGIQISCDFRRDEQFRKALQYLKNLFRPTIQQMANYAGCSPRHIQAVLSDNEKRGVGGAIGTSLAKGFGLSYRDMLDLGQHLIDGQPSSDWGAMSKISIDQNMFVNHDLIESVSCGQPAIAHMADKPEPSNVAPHYPTRPVIQVPLISWVQAGDFIDPQAQTTPGYAETWYATTATSSLSAFALVVHGDSMEPEFREGDIITVDPDRRAENGSYVIVKNGPEATFKQYVVDGTSVFLKPLNGRYPIRDMTGIEFRIVGVVVEKRKGY